MNRKEVGRRIERLSFLNGLVVTGAMVSNQGGGSGKRDKLSEAAKFLCLSCAHEWIAPLGAAQCSECGHEYVHWSNYEVYVQRSSRPRLLAELPPRGPGVLAASRGQE